MFFFSRGQFSACCQRRYLCSRGGRGDSHPCVMRRTAQPALAAAGLARRHPRFAACPTSHRCVHIVCVRVVYLCVCVCQHVTQQSLVLRVRVRVRVRVLPEPIRGLFSTLHGCCHNHYGVMRCCLGGVSLECPALGVRGLALSKRRSGLFASETMFSFRFCTADAAYPARHRC